ncbi:MAG: hypothetical protein Q4C20_01505 [Erysipelotrichaceae bacterium]|nr:hypothetical protein [Erysipelotrichaceae bacterium]
MKTEERVLKIAYETEKLLEQMYELTVLDHSSFWEERLEVLKSLNQFMNEAYQIYQEADRKIEDAVNHERIFWPKTEFGTNRFDQLAELDYLIHPEIQKNN